MFKRTLIGLLAATTIAISVVGAWGGTRASGGSLVGCIGVYDLDANGVFNTPPDIGCSYIGLVAWRGGFAGTAVAVGTIEVAKAILVCDNFGTAFKVTFPGKGGSVDITSTASFIGETDESGHFDTFYHFPNRRDQFASDEEFFLYWTGATTNLCKSKWTPVEVRIVEVVLTGEIGTKCDNLSDITTCDTVSEGSFSCRTSNPLEPQLSDVLFTCSGPL